ncbi:MAG: hypothetical protein UT56_C0004G0007 [Candidatus Levybacteria bacterium GW2011_GWB1_39_7]|nr:MAG: hypothetical protein UT56_C0004G0007 [Candidatus Levybacteria bacterium GW2011_GWB1_39_7]KKR27123.1 MAG: hypothetical protein UT57_C0017G0008 [Microgenomates group bacterium GW2011_GWC1_39_7]
MLSRNLLILVGSYSSFVYYPVHMPKIYASNKCNHFFGLLAFMGIERNLFYPMQSEIPGHIFPSSKGERYNKTKSIVFIDIFC